MDDVEQFCTWEYDGYEDAWVSECGELFVFDSDGPEENGMTYCPFCGDPIFL